jgi:hypothetical protein
MPLPGVLAAIGLLAALTGCGSGGDQPTTSDAGGPITVEQLLARSADTPVAVQGLLLVDQGVARLCAAILEPSAELAGLDLSTVEGTTTAHGVTWKEGAVLTCSEPETADSRSSMSWRGSVRRSCLGCTQESPIRPGR